MKVIAGIKMVPASEGGRSRPLAGGTYTPTTMIEREGSVSHWSITLNLLEQGVDDTWYAIARFVSPHAPSELLYPENVLDLYEGPHVVGHLRVLMPAKVIEKVSVATL
ncbi:hypothetical protein GGR28_002365 [Lewinella aquimaris]|uniref:Uncharacterized protein n=1 Tax=Neolewinella aquimaris TaxID=1835722 RepID=A0A840E3T6_9BACT|nr:hypothetical protein [Neolewinella aquimaris]